MTHAAPIRGIGATSPEESAAGRRIEGTINESLRLAIVDRDELIAKMRDRVRRCRRLADATTDLRTAKILRAMADEGDADIARLLADEGRV